MCTQFTVWCAYISLRDVHTIHSVMCTRFTCDVHTFHCVMCTQFTVWCAHVSLCDVHTFHCVMCTQFTVWCAHISLRDVHTFHCVTCSLFTVWCATFHTTGGFLIVRYWHSSAAITHTKALMCGTQQCCRTTWLRYDVQYSTSSMFVKLDIRGFIPSYSSTIMSLIDLLWLVPTNRDEATWTARRVHEFRPISQVPLNSVKWVCLLSCCAGCCFALPKVCIVLRTKLNAFYAFCGYSKRPSQTLRKFLEQTNFLH